LHNAIQLDLIFFISWPSEAWVRKYLVLGIKRLGTTGKVNDLIDVSAIIRSLLKNICNLLRSSSECPLPIFHFSVLEEFTRSATGSKIDGINRWKEHSNAYLLDGDYNKYSHTICCMRAQC